MKVTKILTETAGHNDQVKWLLCYAAGSAGLRKHSLRKPMSCPAQLQKGKKRRRMSLSYFTVIWECAWTKRLPSPVFCEEQAETVFLSRKRFVNLFLLPATAHSDLLGDISRNLKFNSSMTEWKKAEPQTRGSAKITSIPKLLLWGPFLLPRRSTKERLINGHVQCPLLQPCLFCWLSADMQETHNVCWSGKVPSTRNKDIHLLVGRQRTRSSASNGGWSKSQRPNKSQVSFIANGFSGNSSFLLERKNVQKTHLSRPIDKPMVLHRYQWTWQYTTCPPDKNRNEKLTQSADAAQRTSFTRDISAAS